MKRAQETQEAKHAETEQQKRRVEQDIQRRTTEKQELEENLEQLMKDLKDKESEIRKVFERIDSESQAIDRQENQNQLLRETFSEVENFTVLMDRFKNKLDDKVDQVRD